MPCPFDTFDERASAATARESNSTWRMLDEAMRKEGFEVYVEEWWHYNYKVEVHCRLWSRCGSRADVAVATGRKELSSSQRRLSRGASSGI
eukprot:scaffold18_cov401-Prasinococcus_capsulatus_cf.AAC.8